MLLLCACLAVLAFAATADDGASTHAPALLLRAVLVALIALSGGATPRAHPPPRLLRLAAIMGLVAAAWGVLLSPNPWLGMQAAANAVLVVILYWSLSLAPRLFSVRILQTAGIMGLLHVLWALAQRLTGVDRAHGGFFSPNDLAAFLAPCAALAAWAALKSSVPGERAVYATAALGLAVGIWTSGSRGGLVGVAGGLAVLGVPVCWRSRFKWLLAVGPVLIAAAAFLLLRHRWVDTGDPYAYSRWDIWNASLRVFATRPWGVGLGGYADALRVEGVPLRGWVQYPRVANNAHNEWMQALVECGVLGGLAAILAPAAVIWAAKRNRKDGSRDLATLFAFAVPALTTATLHLPPVAFLAAVWAAYATHGGALEMPATDVSAGSGHRGVLAMPAQTSEVSSHRRALAAAAVAAFLLTLPASLSTLSMGMAVRKRSEHDLTAALKWATTATALNPQSAGAAMLRASLQYQLRPVPLEAVEKLVTLADSYPQSPDPPLRAAQLLASISNNPNQWLATAHLFERAAQRDPHNALHWSDAGEAYRRAGNTNEAQRVYRRALLEEPHCARALRAMAEMAAAAGQEEVAMELRTQVQASLNEAPHVMGYLKEVLSLGN